MTEQQVNEAKDSPQKSNKKRCRRFFCGIAFLLFLIIALLGGALTNGYGQRGLIKLTDRLMYSLNIGDINGSLGDGLVLDHVQYQSAGIDVDINKIRLQLDLGCLWRAEICLRDLSIETPQIRIDTANLPTTPEEPQQESVSLTKVWLPVSVDVENISLDNLNLLIDQKQINLAHFHTAATLNNEQGLTLLPTDINGVDIFFPLEQQTAEVNTQQPSEPIDWTHLEQTLTPSLLGNLQRIDLPFDLHIQQLSAKDWLLRQADIKGNIETTTLSSLELLLDSTNGELQLTRLDLQSSLGSLEGRGQAQLFGDFPVNLNLQANLNEIKEKNTQLLPKTMLNLQVDGKLKQITSLNLTANGVADAELHGELQLAQEKLPLNIALNIKHGAYAFTAGAPLLLDDIIFKVSGNLLDYQTTLNGRVSGMDTLPKTQIALDAQGKLYQINIKQLTLSALDGDAQLSGLVNWQDGVTWDSNLKLNKMNLRPYLPAMPAIISGELASQGAVSEKNWLVDVPKLNLQGSLSNHPLNLQGNLTLTQQTLLNVPSLLLTYGDNKIAISGVVSDNSDFNLNIQAPNLSGLWQDLSGAIRGELRLTGKLNSPHIDADLAVPKLHFQSLNISNGLIKGQISSDPIIRGELVVSLNSLNYGEQLKLNAIKLVVSGDEKSHQLSLQSKGSPVSANLNLAGGFNRQTAQWQGHLNNIDIDSPLGDFRVNQPVLFNYDNAKVEAQIAAHCWLNKDIELCFPQAFNVGKNGALAFDIKRINLQLVNELLKQDSLKGQLQSHGKVAWFADKPLQLNIDVEGNNLALAQPLDYRTFRLNVPKLSLNAVMENNNLALQSAIQIQDQGLIKTNVKISDLLKNRQLGGDLTIEGIRLELANQLLNSDEKVSGHITAKLGFSGNLQKPLLNGNLDISGVKTKLRALPFNISEGNIAMHFNGTNSTLNGKIETPDGHLNLIGSAAWPTLDNWTAELRAQTEKFKLDIPSMAKLQLTEDVQIKATPKLLELTGNIDIPWARIAVENLPDSAEPVSEDEVILNGPNKSKEELINRQFASTTQSGMQIRSDLRINIGEDVELKAYGLKTKLQGLLSVKQDKSRLGLFGQIDLQHGRYASFGQDLLIRKGQINFSGLPSQPMLNIEAIRNPEAMEDSNVTAGVKVIGVATSPQVTVFSEPSTSQDQALSYLLTGRSLENSGEAGSGGSVGAALLGMGLAKSGKLVGSIGETFGISDLNLGTSGVGDSSKVVVSGNITNRLQIKYGVGLFDGLAEVTLRYRLMPRLYFQTVSSTNQVFDLLYQFEF